METVTGRRVLIVGAGLAGLNAARTLNQGGCREITIAEGQGRPGGRIWTQWISDDVHGECPVEIGAMWIHGRHGNPIYDYIRNRKLQLDDDPERLRIPDSTKDDEDAASERRDLEDTMREGCINRTQLKEDIPMEILMEMEDLFVKAMEEAESIFHTNTRNGNDTRNQDHPQRDIGMRQYLFQKVCEHMKKRMVPEEQRRLYLMVFRAKLLYECTLNGCNDMDDVSLLQFGTFQWLEGGDPVLRNGYGEVVQSLLEEIPEVQIVYNTAITGIHYQRESDPSGGSGILVTSDTEQVFEADHVIYTGSLGALKHSHATLFHPALPVSHASAIESLAIDTVDKILLQFDDLSFLPPGVADVWFYWDLEQGDDLDPVIDDPKHWCRQIGGLYMLQNTSQPLMLGWLCGDAAAQMEEESDDAVIDVCRKLLQRFLGVPHVPKPVRLMRSAWHSNPFTKGSYSYIPVHSDVKHIHTLMEPIVMNNRNSLSFAGEATHPTFYSTTHGAFLSGERAAQQILTHIEDR